MEQERDGTYKVQTYFFWVSVGCIFVYFIAFNWEWVAKGFGSSFTLARVIVFAGIWLFGILATPKILRLGKKIVTLFENVKEGKDPDDDD